MGEPSALLKAPGESARVVELLEAILSALRASSSPQRPDPARQDVLTVEAAAALGCSRSRVFELLREGTLCRAKRVGRRLAPASATSASSDGSSG